MWQDEASHLTLDQTNLRGGEEEREGKSNRKEIREKDEKEAPTSLYDLQRSVGRFSLGQELKIICLTKATRRYQKHEISSRIQVKSSENQGFRV